MDKQYFHQLLKKYKHGKANEEEKQLLISYYNLLGAEPDLLDEEKKNQIKDEIKKDIWNRIDTAEQPEKKLLHITPMFRAAAAAILVIVCAVAILHRTNQKDEPKQTLVSFLNRQKENRLICLPDGSTVIVNIGSTLSYLPSFADRDQREVYLVGEAFFDIAHDPSKPFVVHTGAVQTTVLGTAFNIKTCGGDERVTVTVTRGKVKVSDPSKTLALITRGQEITYDKKKGAAIQKSVDSATEISWKKQDLFLDDVAVEDAAKLLEDRFDVSISVNDVSIKKNRFTTVFLKNESLEQVLSSVCEFNNARFEYNRQTSTINILKKN